MKPSTRARAVTLVAVAMLAAEGCDKKEAKQSNRVPEATRSVEESKAAQQVVDLPEAKAFVKAEAALQAAVEPGPAALFFERAQALTGAGKALAAKIPNQAYETALPDKLHQVLGMLGGLQQEMTEDPEARKRWAGVVHRSLAAVFPLEPLPYEEVTTVRMNMRQFCDKLAQGLELAIKECGAQAAALPPCCIGAECAEPLNLSLAKIEVCSQEAVALGCTGKLTALPVACKRESLVD